jgi:hypothetical protein
MTIKNSTSNRNAETRNEESSSEHIKVRVKLVRMIKENGVKPLTADQLRAMCEPWLEAESADEFQLGASGRGH